MIVAEVTLHDANMLWSVTQTADTLNTGDHSVPRMEAQICDESEIGTRGGWTWTHMSVGVHMLRSGQRSFPLRFEHSQRTGCRGAW